MSGTLAPVRAVGEPAATATAGRRRAAWPLAVVALIAGSCLLWLPYLGYAPLHVDAAGYATAAYWWARGGTLYREITITRPQGIFVVYRLIEALGLGSPRGIYLFAMAYNTGSALVLLALTGRLWGRWTGLGAAALFAAVMATPHLQGYTANAELFMLLPLLGSLYLLLRADDHPLDSWRARWLVAGSGFLAAIALLIKPSGVAVLPLAMLWLLRRWRTGGEPWGHWLRAEVLLLLGFAAGLAPALIHGLLTVPDLYLSSVLFNRLSQDSAVAASPGYQLYRLANNSLAILIRLPIFLMVPVGLWSLHRGRDADGGGERGATARTFLWLWLLTSFAGAALGGNWYLHYYQQLLPPLAVAAALGLRRLCRRPTHALQAVLQALALVGLLALGLTYVELLARGADPANLPEYEPSASAVRPVAAYLREHTSPDETIYVAYDRADIYYLSQRRPAAR